MLDKEALMNFSLFSDVPIDQLKAISDSCDRLEYESGQVIFSRDDQANNLNGVLDGEVELTLTFQDKILKTEIEYEESIISKIEVLEKPIVVDTNGPGDIFGWSCLVNPKRMTSTARCTTQTNIFSIAAINLKAMFDQNPKLGYLMMGRLAEIISQRLQTRTEKLIEAWGEAFGLAKI